jgi:hypothetical protein
MKNKLIALTSSTQEEKNSKFKIQNSKFVQWHLVVMQIELFSLKSLPNSQKFDNLHNAKY